MKQKAEFIILVALLLVPPFVCRAANYYFSASGDDSRTASQAQNPSTPWRSIAKLNSFFVRALPGDSLLFKSGEEFPGSITISRSGASGNPIVIGSYGPGPKPIITGFTTVPSWTLTGAGIYETTVASAVTMVVMDGVFEPIGRWPKANSPNSGYLAYQSHSGTSSITSNGISDALSYQGGEVVIRKVHWILDKGIVTSQSSSTVSYSGGGYESTDNFGFFFQNHQNTLTTLGEWCYEPFTKKLKIFFGSSGPGSHVVKYASQPSIVTANSKSWITLYNLSIQGSNSSSVNIPGSSNIKILSCDISFSGVDAIVTTGSCSNISLINSTINWTNNNAISGASAPGWMIQNNQISNTGSIAGMGGSGDGKYTGIYDVGSGSLVEGNVVRNTGYIGINFSSADGSGNSVIVRNNLVDTYCITKDDGGGIYTWAGTTPVSFTQRTISNNIIINGIGAANGAGGENTSVFGIYMDDNVSNVTITGNSCANIQGAGIYLHNARNLDISGNTTYNSSDNELMMVGNSGSQPFRGINMNNNIFFSKTNTTDFSSFVVDLRSAANDFAQFGVWDNNYYCRPLPEEQQAFFVRRPGLKDFAGTLTGWQELGYGLDPHSKKTPIAITDTSKIRFEYNATAQTKTIQLGASYIDVKENNFTGFINLGPYSSCVLLQESNHIKGKTSGKKIRTWTLIYVIATLVTFLSVFAYYLSRYRRKSHK